MENIDTFGYEKNDLTGDKDNNIFLAADFVN